MRRSQRFSLTVCDVQKLSDQPSPATQARLCSNRGRDITFYNGCTLILNGFEKRPLLLLSSNAFSKHDPMGTLSRYDSAGNQVL